MKPAGTTLLLIALFIAALLALGTLAACPSGATKSTTKPVEVKKTNKTNRGKHHKRRNGYRPAKRKHNAHPHGHGVHPHGAGAHHHHRHPHPHMTGPGNHHHPF